VDGESNATATATNKMTS